MSQASLDLTYSKRTIVEYKKHKQIFFQDKNIMKQIITTIIVLVVATCATAKDIAIKAKYDERVELMSILCHLAGYREYNMNMGGDYISDIDRYFSDVKSHPAVVMMDSLRNKKGIGYDSPMFFAVFLDKKDGSFVLPSDDVVPERRWKGVDLKHAIETINDFYVKSDFATFFEQHKAFYQTICDAYDSIIISKFNQNWYEQFYGVPPTDNFEVVIGFTCGGGNYGPSRQLPDRPRDVYAIVGYALDENEKPYFESEPETFFNALVHEFNHSFVNPLTADNSAQMEDIGKELMRFSENVMRKNAYNNWQTIINESIVRAAVILYNIDNGASADTVRQLVIDEMATGFNWMPELVKCLQSYSKNRDKYPTFGKYYPAITDSLNSYVDEISMRVNNIMLRK